MEKISIHGAYPPAISYSEMENHQFDSIRGSLSPSLSLYIYIHCILLSGGIVLEWWLVCGESSPFIALFHLCGEAGQREDQWPCFTYSQVPGQWIVISIYKYAYGMWTFCEYLFLEFKLFIEVSYSWQMYIEYIYIHCAYDIILCVYIYRI